MQPFQGSIEQVVYANQIIVKSQNQQFTVIIGGVAYPQDPSVSLSAKEFLRSKIVGKSCTVTPFKKLDENKVIGRVTMATANLAVQLAKNGYCKPFGAGEEADLVKQAMPEEPNPVIYKFVDMSKKSYELERFANRKEEFSGYIDHIRDADTFVLIAKLPDNTLLRFIGSLHGVFSSGDTQRVLESYVQRTCKIQVVCNTVSNIVECYLVYEQKNGYELNLNDFMVKKGVALAGGVVKEKGAFNGGLVVAINSGDSVNVMLPTGEEKIYLASVMAPKFFIMGYNPVIDPYGYEAKNWLRYRLYGCKITYYIDYIREMEDGSKRQYCTVFHDGENVSQEYLRTGLAKVVRHSLKDMNRSAFYQELYEAQQQAEAEHIGQFSEAEAIRYRISDFSALKPDELKARAARFSAQKKQISAIVEQIITPSKFKILLKIDQYTLAFIIVQLAGVSTPNIKRDESGSVEALEFSRRYLYYTVRVTFTGETEKHTNALFVFCYQDEFLVNCEIIKAGCGYFQPFGNSVEFDILKKAENAARAAKKGIFGSIIPVCKIERKTKVEIISVTADGGFVVREAQTPLPVLERKIELPQAEIQKNRFCGVFHEEQLFRCKITYILPIYVYLIDTGRSINVEKDKLFRLREYDYEAGQQVITVQNALIDIKLRDEAVAEASNLIGEHLYCYAVDNGVFMMASGVEQLSAVDSFSGYLVEKGIARVVEDYNGEYCQELFELEQGAISGQRGFWKE